MNAPKLTLEDIITLIQTFEGEFIIHIVKDEEGEDE